MIALTEKQLRRRAAAKAARRDRRRVGALKGNKPVRDKSYRSWIASLNCIVPGCTSVNLHKWTAAGAWTEAAHTGPHGISQKASDYSCVPICHWHHLESRDSYHKLGERKFEAHHRISIKEIVKVLRARYEAGRAAA